MKPKFLLLMLIPLLHGMFTTKETLNNHATNMMDMSIEDIVYNSFSQQEEMPGEPKEIVCECGGRSKKTRPLRIEFVEQMAWYEV